LHYKHYDFNINNSVANSAMIKKAKPNSGQDYKTLKDLARILSLFNSPQIQEISISEISKSLNMLPSKISRMIRTLEKDGFFQKNLETGKYRLGIAFFELGIIFALNLPLRQIIRPHIEQIAKDHNLTASWGILSKGKVIVVDRVQNLNIDLLAYRVGFNIPIHSSSIGKVLLAYLPGKELDEILKTIKFEKFTPTTIGEVGLFKKQLSEVKERGYSVDNGETHEEIYSIAVPIRNAEGNVIAALNLTSEKKHPNVEKIFKLSDCLKEKGLFISRQLGYRNNS
jgi:IclR family transcriptional regulator, KDG regulon repressor